MPTRKIIGTLYTTPKRQLQSAIYAKVLKGKRVNTSQLFNVFVAPQLKKCIANWGMTEHIVNILLVAENSNGFNSTKISIVKSVECSRLTNDLGDGLPDKHWHEKLWMPFIKDIRQAISVYYELQMMWDVKKLAPETILENIQNDEK